MTATPYLQFAPYNLELLRIPKRHASQTVPKDPLAGAALVGKLNACRPAALSSVRNGMSTDCVTLFSFKDQRTGFGVTPSKVRIWGSEPGEFGNRPTVPNRRNLPNQVRVHGRDMSRSRTTTLRLMPKPTGRSVVITHVFRALYHPKLRPLI